jgi:diaminopropionate ammonia-lyase
VIFLHEGVSTAREAAITELGAAVVRTSGNYDDSVRIAADTARAKHWEIISDTTWPGYETVPAIVMQGYGVLVLEILEQLREQDAQMPTHVFLQGGVGGLAATVSGLLWEALGSAAPVFVAVEPESADCLFQSALAGHPASASGDMDTVMAGLSCGEVSIIAWEILQACAEFFMTIPDEAAIDSMRLLARGAFGDPPIIAGESATPGLAALLNIAAAGKSAQLRMNKHSCALVIGTEGATDPEIYRRLVGFTPRLESTPCGVCA